jgi:hypothetical protein
MRATEILRNFLDLIDNIETAQKPPVVVQITKTTHSPDPHDVDDNRFKQIKDLISDKHPGVQNRPREEYADIDSVTNNAGGGMNGPKHPDDLRIKDPRQN